MIYRDGASGVHVRRARPTGENGAVASSSAARDASLLLEDCCGEPVSRIVPGLTNGESRRIVASIREAVPAEAVYVFGSRARGDFGPDSDVDIFVVADDDSNWSHAKVRGALSWLKMPKDVLVESRELYREGVSRFGFVEREVATEGVKLYGRPES